MNFSIVDWIRTHFPSERDHFLFANRQTVSIQRLVLCRRRNGIKRPNKWAAYQRKFFYFLQNGLIHAIGVCIQLEN